MKRYSIDLEHFNDESHSVFESDSLSECLRYIADEIEDVEYPERGDNTADKLYCYIITDEMKREEVDDETTMASEIFRTDYFYIDS